MQNQAFHSDNIDQTQGIMVSDRFNTIVGSVSKFIEKFKTSEGDGKKIDHYRAIPDMLAYISLFDMSFSNYVKLYQDGTQGVTPHKLAPYFENRWRGLFTLFVLNKQIGLNIKKDRIVLSNLNDEDSVFLHSFKFYAENTPDLCRHFEFKAGTPEINHVDVYFCEACVIPENDSPENKTDVALAISSEKYGFIPAREINSVPLFSNKPYSFNNASSDLPQNTIKNFCFLSLSSEQNSPDEDSTTRHLEFSSITSANVISWLNRPENELNKLLICDTLETTLNMGGIDPTLELLLKRFRNELGQQPKVAFTSCCDRIIDKFKSKLFDSEREDIEKASEVFLEKIYLTYNCNIPDDADNYPGCWNKRTVIINGQTYDAIMPVKRQFIIDKMNGNVPEEKIAKDLSEQVRVTCENGIIRVEYDYVSVNGGKRTATKFYQSDAIEKNDPSKVANQQPPVIGVFPNRQLERFKRYYSVCYSDISSAGVGDFLKNAKFIPMAKRPLDEKRAESHFAHRKDSIRAYKTITSEFPYLHYGDIGGEDIGVIIAKPSDEAVAEDCNTYIALLGIDLGTTNSCIYSRKITLGPNQNDKLGYNDNHSDSEKLYPVQEPVLYVTKAESTYTNNLFTQGFIPQGILTKGEPFKTIVAYYKDSAVSAENQVASSQYKELFDINTYYQGNISKAYSLPDILGTDLKWGGAEEENRFKCFVIETLVIAMWQLLLKGYDDFIFRFAYPSSHPSITQYKANIKSWIESAYYSVTGKKFADAKHYTKYITDEDMYVQSTTENHAGGYYVYTRMDNVVNVHKGFVSIDIGGGSTDISIWQGATAELTAPLVESSIKYAGNDILYGVFKKIAKNKINLRDFLNAFSFEAEVVNQFISATNENEDPNKLESLFDGVIGQISKKLCSREHTTDANVELFKNIAVLNLMALTYFSSVLLFNSIYYELLSKDLSDFEIDSKHIKNSTGHRTYRFFPNQKLSVVYGGNVSVCTKWFDQDSLRRIIKDIFSELRLGDKLQEMATEDEKEIAANMRKLDIDFCCVGNPKEQVARGLISNPQLFEQSYYELRDASEWLTVKSDGITMYKYKNSKNTDECMVVNRVIIYFSAFLNIVFATEGAKDYGFADMKGFKSLVEKGRNGDESGGDGNSDLSDGVKEAITSILTTLRDKINVSLIGKKNYDIRDAFRDCMSKLNDILLEEYDN